ncbi:glycerol-3-phosphate 1-O-acyltransferase PlsY [Massilibacterium senegalense]|uniref:glycerol-3-phosphate 1-O-acyltransferase PlsY n=1 Tax=Massilibacterium senegalense TaxID=1632858 RepID=UPI000785C177|nr:glycerol-3-phosphate 1-O-acyltransferase PlsY [Massilibacterium senegalense]
MISYLIGAISFSYILTKKFKKVDIRKMGSGNAGATNTLRVLGVGPAITVLLLDVSKGIIAVLLGVTFSGDEWVIALCGLAAIIGHNWPIYYGFRGGKGVATTIGVLAMLMFFPALYAGIIAILTIVLTRYVSLGALLFMAFTTIFAGFSKNVPDPYFYLAMIVTLISFWRHRTNIQRLWNGTENKLSKKKD